MWRKSQSLGSVMPAEIDAETSKSVVYIRRNFEQVEIEDDETGETRTAWEYDEAKIPQTDYPVYEELLEQAEQNAADIGYIAMMSDIELEG